MQYVPGRDVSHSVTWQLGYSGLVKHPTSVILSSLASQHACIAFGTSRLSPAPTRPYTTAEADSWQRLGPLTGVCTKSSLAQTSGELKIPVSEHSSNIAQAWIHDQPLPPVVPAPVQSVTFVSIGSRRADRLRTPQCRSPVDPQAQPVAVCEIHPCLAICTVRIDHCPRYGLTACEHCSALSDGNTVEGNPANSLHARNILPHDFNLSLILCTACTLK